MKQVVDYISSISSIQIIDIVVAICIIILFRIFSSNIAYFIIKMFKFKTKNKNKIKMIKRDLIKETIPDETGTPIVWIIPGISTIVWRFSIIPLPSS